MIQNLCVLDSIKIHGFIRIYDGTRYLTLFGSEKYEAIYNRIRYLIRLKSGIKYIFSHYFAKINVDSYDYLPVERILTLCNGCHDLSMLCLNIGDIAIITVKNINYVVLFITLANLKQLIYLKILFLKIVSIHKKHCLKFQAIQDSFFLLFVLIYIKELILMTSISL